MRFFVKPFQNGKEDVYSFYLANSPEDFTGLELVDIRVIDFNGNKVRNMRFGGSFLLRYGREFVSDRYDRPIAFETVEEGIDAVEAECERWISRMRGLAECDAASRANSMVFGLQHRLNDFLG